MIDALPYDSWSGVAVEFLDGVIATVPVAGCEGYRFNDTEIKAVFGEKCVFVLHSPSCSVRPIVAEAELMLRISTRQQLVNLLPQPPPAQWVVLAPRGEHRLDISTLTSVGLAVNRSSWILSSITAVLDAAATLLMSWIYL